MGGCNHQFKQGSFEPGAVKTCEGCGVELCGAFVPGGYACLREKGHEGACDNPNKNRRIEAVPVRFFDPFRGIKCTGEGFAFRIIFPPKP